MSGTTIVAALEDAWRAVQEENPEVPDAIVVTGRRRHKSESATRAQFCKASWTYGDGRLPEVWVSGERLADGGLEVMATLLHEAAHGLAGERDVRDTSNRGRYHNKAFVRLAEELGLEGPESSGGPSLGYSDCKITSETAGIYQRTIERLDGACKSFVSQVPDEDKDKPKRAKRTAACDCPDGEIPWSKKMQQFVEDFGPIQHQTCRGFFTETEAEA